MRWSLSVDHNWKICQVLARLAVLSKSLTGDQFAAELNDIISTTIQVRKHQIMAIMRDGASVNGAAMRVFRDLYPSFIDITCFVHTIDRVGVYLGAVNTRSVHEMVGSAPRSNFCSQALLKAMHWCQYENIFANKMVDQLGAKAVCYDRLC